MTTPPARRRPASWPLTRRPWRPSPRSGGRSQSLSCPVAWRRRTDLPRPSSSSTPPSGPFSMARSVEGSRCRSRARQRGWRVTSTRARSMPPASVIPPAATPRSRTAATRSSVRRGLPERGDPGRRRTAPGATAIGTGPADGEVFDGWLACHQLLECLAVRCDRRHACDKCPELIDRRRICFVVGSQPRLGVRRAHRRLRRRLRQARGGRSWAASSVRLLVEHAGQALQAPVHERPGGRRRDAHHAGDGVIRQVLVIAQVDRGALAAG